MRNITILNFSSRVSGNCAEIAKYISAFHENSNICIYNVNKYSGRCDNCNYECLTPGAVCPTTDGMNELMNRAMESNLIYYIVPNICGYPSANYFVFNERTVGYFNMNREVMKQYKDISKKFIIISNTESDAFNKAMEQQATNPQILYLKTSKYGKRSTTGDILESDAAQADLKEFLKNT